MFKQELFNILCSDNVVESIRKNEDALFHYIPELKLEKNFDQKSEWHIYSVWEHTLKVLELSENDFELRIILLLHDIGKPYSFQDDGEIRHFKGHAKKSSEIAETVLKRIGFSDEEIKRICFYIENHASQIENLNIQDSDMYNKLLNIMFLDANGYAPDKTKIIHQKLKKLEK